jgi:hypothetical protein
MGVWLKAVTIETMPQYTCQEYRREMMLAGLKKRVSHPGLSEDEREILRREIRRLEAELEMD